jgi:hypothetical protein
VGIQGQHNARVALDVAQLGAPAHVPADKIVAVLPDPDHGHLGAAVGVDRAQMRHRARRDQIP